MSEALTPERTAEMLLWYYEEPRRYRAEGRRRDAPLLDSAVVLKLALGRPVVFASSALSDPGTLSTLRDAAALYVRFLFFRQDATPYQVLGLASDTSPEAIRESFRLLMHLVHPDRQDARATWPDSFAALANRAYGVLKNQDARIRFDREAAARAAMARAVNRAAAAHEASRMPVPLGPRVRSGRRGPLAGVTLPEWWTAGVGGFVRRHPSVTAFSSLIAVAMLAVSLMLWENDELLIRDVEASAEEPSASRARLPKLSWFSNPVASAPAYSVSAPNASQGAARGTRERKTSGVVDAAAMPLPADVPDPQRAVVADTVTVAVPPVAGATRTVAPDTPASAASSPRDFAVSTASAAPNAGANAGGAAVVPASAAPPGAAASASGRQLAHAEASSAPPAIAASATTSTGIPDGPGVSVSSALSAAPNPAATPGSTNVGVDTIATATHSSASTSPPASTEIESLFATFVENYERGRVDAFAALFDEDADTNLRRGRAAIRGEYDELFRLSQWRKMQLTRVNWRRVGDRAVAKGEITVKIGWSDGREVEQRLAVDMEIVRRDGRVLIAKLSHQPRN